MATSRLFQVSGFWRKLPGQTQFQSNIEYRILTSKSTPRKPGNGSKRHGNMTDLQEYVYFKLNARTRRCRHPVKHREKMEKTYAEWDILLKRLYVKDGDNE